MCLRVCSLFFLFSRSAASAERRPERSPTLHAHGGSARAHQHLSTSCPGSGTPHAPWTVNQVTSAAVHPLPHLSPFCPASTLVRWLPHPDAPGASWSRIWSRESPETQRAPSEPGSADPGSEPRHRRIWPWRWRETLWTSWRTCRRCTTSTRSPGTSPPPK